MERRPQISYGEYQSECRAATVAEVGQWVTTDEDVQDEERDGVTVRVMQPGTWHYPCGA